MSHMDLTRVGCGSNTIQNIREASAAIAAKDEGVGVWAGLLFWLQEKKVRLKSKRKVIGTCFRDQRSRSRNIRQ
jgi:hypothetical protein